MSSGSDSDEEFVPGEPEQLSEEESANEETDLQYEIEQEHKTNKRKATEDGRNANKRKTRNSKESNVEKQKPVTPEQPLDPVEEKKKEEDLWAKFLEGTDTKPKSIVDQKVTTNSKLAITKNDDTSKTTNEKKNTDEDKAREKRIFEFAGETIVVENNIIKEKINTKNDSLGTAVASGPSFGRRSGGGLSSVLGSLNKNNKISTLEKSKLDWESYKKTEEIEDEIQHHNKGRDGYLDRQDFLERTDHRQFEIERNLRTNKRSNR